MKLLYIDIGLLVLFVVFISFFLYRNRKNLKRDGLLYLYRAKWGMNLIDKVGGKHPKTLKFISYISITVGYLLMAGMLWLFGKIIYLYIAFPAVVRAIKIPPITPLIPYLPQAFKLDFLPPFYFTYWIIVLAIIAITHEFAHGIFMKRYGIKIKSTGFGFFPFFLPIFLAAFVEQDEESMKKSKIFHQMSVLSAGTFANILTAIVFFGVMVLFFVLAFSPAGAQFNTYSYSIVGISAITSVNGVQLENPTYESIFNLSSEGFNKFGSSERYFVGTKDFLREQKKNAVGGFLVLYDNSPAINANLEGAIYEFNGVKVNSWDDLGDEINNYEPGDKITLKTKIRDEEKEYEITLGENPSNSEQAWIGIGYKESERKGIVGKFTTLLSSFKKGYLYYEERFSGGEFIYHLLWWLVLISFSVALVNMLPMGIFDGGRFFYLTILAITKSKKKAEKTFRFATYFLLLLVLALMILWAVSFW